MEPIVPVGAQRGAVPIDPPARPDRVTARRDRDAGAGERRRRRPPPPSDEQAVPDEHGHVDVSA